tara:strand:+ start:3200 stop:4531 length:1332 start_codon:yes stop_codon:yes gene_type:complete
MAAVSGPSLNTDGVVFSLDASSPNCWNVGISTAFVDNVNSHQGFPINDLYHSDGPFVDAGYVEFDGTGDYVDIASSSDFIFDGDFTIEYWIYREGGNVWFDISNTGSYTNAINFYSSSGNLLFYMGGTPATNVGGDGYMNVPTNQWVHHAVSRSGTNCRVFADGVLKKTTTLSGTAGNNGSNILRLGAQIYGGPSEYFQGKLSNLRIVKGTALYTAAFTPPTKPLTAVANTKLLTCQGNTITDASSSGHTLSANGDASAKLGSPSYFEFDGTSDFIDFPASADFALGTGNFTIELWMNSGVNSNDTFYRRMYMTDGPTGNASGNFQIAIEPSTGKVNLWENSGDLNLLGTSNITNSTWNHIVAVRLGSTLKIYVNGVEESSTTYSTSVTANSGSPRPRIGNYGGGGGTGDYSGKISNFKIYKGTGLSPKQIRQNYNALKSRFA